MEPIYLSDVMATDSVGLQGRAGYSRTSDTIATLSIEWPYPIGLFQFTLTFTSTTSGSFRLYLIARNCYASGTFQLSS